MASRDILNALSLDLVSAIRKADVLTGQFLRRVPPDAAFRLESIGLASSSGGGLTHLGMKVRSWLMSGAEHAPIEVARLLAASGAGRVAAGQET